MKKEYVLGNAYIASRNWKVTITCNFCGHETSTVIRDPDLGVYLGFCESCQRVPHSAWHIPEFPEKIIREGKTIDLFDSLMEEFELTGFNKVIAWRLAVWTIRKSQREVFFNDNMEKYTTNYSKQVDNEKGIPEDENMPSISMWLEDYMELEHQYLSEIIDVNILLKQILSVINDEERRILAVLISEYQLDKDLSQDTVSDLYRDLDMRCDIKFSERKIAAFLGYQTQKSPGVRKYLRALNSLKRKVTNILKRANYLPYDDMSDITNVAPIFQLT